jgi:integrase family protein with SAM-like domain
LLRKLVLDAMPSPHTQRNYAKALDDLFAFCASRPLSRSLLMEWRAGMESLSPSTINVRLSAVRKLVGEARRAGMIGQEEAAIHAFQMENAWDTNLTAERHDGRPAMEARRVSRVEFRPVEGQTSRAAKIGAYSRSFEPGKNWRWC